MKQLYLSTSYCLLTQMHQLIFVAFGILTVNILWFADPESLKISKWTGYNSRPTANCNHHHQLCRQSWTSVESVSLHQRPILLCVCVWGGGGVILLHAFVFLFCIILFTVKSFVLVENRYSRNVPLLCLLNALWTHLVSREMDAWRMDQAFGPVQSGPHSKNGH